MRRKIVAVGVSLLTIFCCITIILNISPIASGDTITVDDDGPADHSKIQDAINASSTGDTVFVYSGTYCENLVVNKTINLIGEDKETTIIDGTKTDNTVFVTANWVNVTGFTITNASTSWAQKDGGIKLSSVNNVTIRDNICTGNLIGIMVYDSSHCRIENNDCDSNSNSAIRLEIQCEYNVVKNNLARYNVAGIVLWTGGSYNIISHNNASSNNPYHGINLDTNCHWNNITNNYVSSNGDEGIYLVGNNDNNQIRNNTIRSNGDHGVILSSGSDNNKVFHNNFFFNSIQATDSGSANLWDNGYPSGGNYWSNFDDSGDGAYDDYQGVNQSINGSDGIVDKGSDAGGGKNPYIVQGGSKDNYPFIEPYSKTTPSAPRNLNAAAGNGFINISWEPPISDGRSNITGYCIHRSDAAGIFAWVPANQLWYYDTSVINGVTFTYNVSAVNTIGEGPNSTDVSATPKTTPSEPRNPYTIAGEGYVILYWEVPESHGGSPITNYRIYKGESSDEEVFLIQIPDITYYIDSDVDGGIIYFYKISAVNIVGEGPLSDETNASFNSVPTEPTGLTASEGDSYVYLEWGEPLSNGGAPITGYLVYRNTTSDGTIIIFDVGNVLFFNDSTVAYGETYEYWVSAKNVEGEGPHSQGVIVTPLTVPSVPLNPDTFSGFMYVTLSWDAPLSDGGSGILHYNIYRNDVSNVYSTVNAPKTVYSDLDVIANTTYFYYISAVNEVGEGPLTGDPWIFGRPKSFPSAPQNLQLIAGDGYVNLIWSFSEEDFGSSITNYVIYKGTVSGDESFFYEIGNLNFFNDTDVINNVNYYYKITAKNAGGESEFSNGANATPKTKLVPVPQEPPDKDEPDKDIPLWLWLLHIIIIVLMITIMVILIMKGRKKEHPQPQEPIDSDNEKQKEYSTTQSQENAEDPPPPPP